MTSRPHASSAETERRRAYDPFARGPLPVGVRTAEARDAARARAFPCEIWFPAAAAHAGQDLDPVRQDRYAVAPGEEPRRQNAVRDAEARPGAHPLVVYSHGSGRGPGARRMATFLCTHLASHGYVVAALDHSELSAPELAPQQNETPAERKVRVEALIASRPQDLRFLIDHLLVNAARELPGIDPGRVGAIGYSFGGWTALAAVELDRRIGAVVALAPAGSARPRPGIAPVTLAFRWGREVPALFLAGAADTMTPLDGMIELFGRAPEPKRLLILERADHMHFIDAVEWEHETFRGIAWGGDLAWIPGAMRPASELTSGEAAHAFVRTLALAHLDATLRDSSAAQSFLQADVAGELAMRGIGARVRADA